MSLFVCVGGGWGGKGGGGQGRWSQATGDEPLLAGISTKINHFVVTIQ